MVKGKKAVYMKLKKRAQSALEYLMTYGWSLIVISIVVGTLIIISSPSGSSTFKCVSSDPNIILKDYIVPASSYVTMGGFERWCSGGVCELTPPFSPSGSNKMILQNAAGGQITIYDIKCGGPNGDMDCCPPLGCPDWELMAQLGYIRSCGMNPPTLQVGGTYAGDCIYDPIVYDPIDEVIEETNPVLVPAGHQFEIIDFVLMYDPNGLSALAQGDPTEPPGYIKLFYKNASGLRKNFTITCSGFPPRP